jgi:hypothetical protein
MKIRPLGAKLFHADGRTDTQTDRHDETNSRFSKFCPPKIFTIIWAVWYITHCFLFHVRPANQATITGVALCQKKIGHLLF